MKEYKKLVEKLIILEEKQKKLEEIIEYLLSGVENCAMSGYVDYLIKKNKRFESINWEVFCQKEKEFKQYRSKNA